MSTEEKFRAAVEIISSLPRNGPFQPSEGMMLKFYAYHRQATEGPCNTPKPSFWDMLSRNRWNAWKTLGNMSKETAMQKYVDELTKVIETMSYSEKVSKFMSLMGPFYEVVWPTEYNMQYEENLPIDMSLRDSTKSKYETISRRMSQEVTSRVYKMSENITFDPDFVESESAYPRKISPVSSSGISSLSSSALEEDIMLNSHIPETIIFSRDLLSLALKNMQHSMEDIANKLDKLQLLAKTAEINHIKQRTDDKQSWDLTLPGTVFALLWPLAVQMCL